MLTSKGSPIRVMLKLREGSTPCKTGWVHIQLWHFAPRHPGQGCLASLTLPPHLSRMGVIVPTELGFQ